MPVPTSRALELLDKVAENTPPDNVRLQNYVSALRSVLEAEVRKQDEQQQMIAEYEDAYAKLTAPANRLGTFLQWLEPRSESLALLALGDQEYVVQIDPKAENIELSPGVRVRLNESYAILGSLPIGMTGPLVKVAEVREDGRIRIGSEMPGSDGRLILIGDSLRDTRISVGDEVRLDASGRFAVEHHERSESRDYFLESVPEIPWESVGGQEQAIKLIRDTIEKPLLHPEIFARFEKKPIKGILLYGPPGCGKTLIGKATAYNLTKEYSARVGRPVKEYFMAISGPKILNMWLGETERIVREIFKTAREKAKEGRLVFIFMDEAESVLRTRSAGRQLNISNTVVPQFCAELDGLQSLENVVLMLTSNRPDYIDPAVLRPERIDRKVKIERPTREAAVQILGIYLHDRIPLDPDALKEHGGDASATRTAFIEAAVEHIWRKAKDTEFLRVNLRNGNTTTLHYSDLVSGALLKAVVDRAKDAAIRRAIEDDVVDAGVSLQDLIDAVEQEYKENEIFPKTDAQEDWLQLLDLQADNVASVKAIGAGSSTASRIKKSIV